MQKIYDDNTLLFKKLDHGKGKKEKESEGNLKNKNVQPDALRLHLTVLKNLSQEKKNPPHLGYENDDMQGKPYGIVTMKDTKGNGGASTISIYYKYQIFKLVEIAYLPPLR